ncbi:hypothetical protein [Methanofollis fontis]|uniref:Uncharacterized protein n=1 Tax=Methanofollis fontis TaxID=2052832 RepID=A0A483CV68_9EURY|nr:hypothetical protein [Methanofollis fontis]TAJ45546.1 hypothetical protein CUJ86_02130 [Methanofollis fontis]
MDKTGIAMIVVGLVLAALGIFGISLLAPEVIAFLIGVIELVVVLIGLGLIVIGAIMAQE